MWIRLLWVFTQEVIIIILIINIGFVWNILFIQEKYWFIYYIKDMYWHGVCINNYWSSKIYILLKLMLILMASIHKGLC